MENCGSGTTSDAGRPNMMTCCDVEGGASYMDTTGICNPCPGIMTIQLAMSHNYFTYILNCSKMLL